MSVSSYISKFTAGRRKPYIVNGSQPRCSFPLTHNSPFLSCVMASVLKVQKSNASHTETRRKGKRKADDMDTDGVLDQISEPVSKKKKNRQRVLMLSSRGITHRMRHLMNDLEALLPHVKKGVLLWPTGILSVDRHLYDQIRNWTRRIILTSSPNLRT